MKYLTQDSLFIIYCLALFFLNTKWLVFSPLYIIILGSTYFLFKEVVEQQQYSARSTAFHVLLMIILPLLIIVLSLKFVLAQ